MFSLQTTEFRIYLSESRNSTEQTETFKAH